MATGGLEVIAVVEGRYKQLETFATDMFNEAKSAVEALEKFSFGYSVSVPDTKIDRVRPEATLDDIAAMYPGVPDYPIAPTEPPQYSVPTPPARPVYDAVIKPTLATITFPSPPSLTVPTFTETIDTWVIDDPSIPSIDALMADYDSELLQAIRNKLIRAIRDGGTALEPDIEAAIWNRDLERNEQALSDAFTKITEQWASMGFTLPDGFLANSIEALDQEYLNRRIDASRQIAIEQAKLEQDNVKYALDQGRQLETAWAQLVNDYANRVAQVGKTVVDAAVAVYTAQWNAYNIYVQVYSVKASVYKTLVEAEMTGVELYKAQVQGAQAASQLNLALVEMYKAELTGNQVLAETYATEMKGVMVELEANKSLLETYKAQIEAFVAKVTGITQKYQGQIAGYKAYVESWVSENEVNARYADVNVRASIAEKELLVKEFDALLRDMEAQVSLRLEAMKSTAMAAGNVAAGALAAVSAQAGMHYSYTESLNTSSKVK